MATVNRVKSTLEGVCVWSYDYDDVTFRLLAFKCVNNHPTRASIGTVWDSDHPPGDPQHFPVSRTVAAQASDNFPIPGAVADKFNLRVDANGRLLNLDCQFSFV